MISPLAYVHPDAQIGENVTVEPFAYIAGDVVINQILLSLKHSVDAQIITNSHLLDNEPYFMQGMFPMIKKEFEKHDLKYTASQVKYVGVCISNEYFTERNFAS